MTTCDPDWCLYAIPSITLDGCDQKVCHEHDADEIVQWDDGQDSGWLHTRGACADCDRFWLDVDVNTKWYAEQSRAATTTDEPAPSLVAAKGQKP